MNPIVHLPVKRLVELAVSLGRDERRRLRAEIGPADEDRRHLLSHHRRAASPGWPARSHTASRRLSRHTRAASGWTYTILLYRGCPWVASAREPAPGQYPRRPSRQNSPGSPARWSAHRCSASGGEISQVVGRERAKLFQVVRRVQAALIDRRLAHDRVEIEAACRAFARSAERTGRPPGTSAGRHSPQERC